MNTSDSKLIYTLVDRLATKLPHRTGAEIEDVKQDSLVVLTQDTLIESSKAHLHVVIDALLPILDDLFRTKTYATDETYLKRSEIYLIGLLASCCEASWDAAQRNPTQRRNRHAAKRSQSGMDSLSMLSDATTLTQNDSSSRGRRSNLELESDASESLSESLNGGTGVLAPPVLENAQAQRFLDSVLRLFSPLPEDFELPSTWLLDGEVRAYHEAIDYTSFHDFPDSMARALDGFGKSASSVVEYLSLSNWSIVFTSFQGKLRQLRSVVSTAIPVNGIQDRHDVDASLLAALQMLVYLHLDGRQLSLILQELNGCFLSLRKDAQVAIAVLLPGAIARWMRNSPAEFASLHTSHNKAINGADVLFEMANAITDSQVRRKGVVWPMQTALVLLVPEAFWVAANMRDSRSGQVTKKASFLEALRKGLTSPRNHQSALFCLIWLCQAATRFQFESESALYSYAVDFQTDVRQGIMHFVEDNPDEGYMDYDLLVASLAAMAQLDPDPILQVVPRFFDSDSPRSLKIGLIGACSALATQDENDRFNAIFTRMAPFLRKHLSHLKSHPSLQNVLGHSNASSPSTPGVEDPIDYGLTNAVLQFCGTRVKTLLEVEDESDETLTEWLADPTRVFVDIMAGEDENLRNRARAVVEQLVMSQDLYELRSRRSPTRKMVFEDMWRFSIHVITTLSNRLLQFRIEDPGIVTLLEFLQHYLGQRLIGMRSLSAEDLKLAMEIAVTTPNRSNSAAALEVASLVLLCCSSPQTCLKITSMLYTYCECGTVIESSDDFARSKIGIMRNYDAYVELSSHDFLMTGSVAFQKRYRKILLKMLRPTAGILTAWETVFDRWRPASARIVQLSSNPSAEEEKTFSEWRNYSGFLAALGGACIADSSQIQRADDPLVVGLRWIDRPNVENDGQSILDEFINRCLDLLVCSSPRVREAMGDILGSELSLRLYPPVFHALQSSLTSIFHGSAQGPTRPTPTDIVPVEQATSLIRTVVERLDDFHETFFSVDLGSLLLNIARHLQMLKSDTASLRVRVRFCQLCEVVTRKKEMLNFRYDVRIRNNLLEILLGWISRSNDSKMESANFSNRSRQDESARLQRDLDRACLRTLIDITYRLPLQPLDGPTGPETSDVRSQLFQTYFGRLLLLLREDNTEHDLRKHLPIGSGNRDSHSVSELAITVLSNMLSANIDVGLKQSLEAGYHDEIEIRTAFVRVLCNILNQGTEFGSLSDSAISEKYEELLEIVIEDMDLVLTICNSCPSGEVDEITVSLLNIFDSRGMGYDLLAALISHEVMNTENESELLRRNCVATKMLSVYAKWKGAAYLKSTLGEVLRRLIVSSDKLDLELDPARVNASEDLQRNALQLQMVSKVFLDDICGSTEKIPPSFRKICNIIMTAVTPRFPEAKFTAVGAFIFLRFFCPAIVAPDSEGLVSSPPTKDMRRGLLLIAKVIQNLANNVLFGIKEPYMLVLNEFLTQNIYRVTAFLKEISTTPREMEPEPQVESFNFGSCVALHGFFYEHWETVRRKLLMKTKSPWKERNGFSSGATNTIQLQERTKSLDKTGDLIASLGVPPQDLAWTRPQISANIPTAYSRFQHFMLKNSGKNVESVISARAVYDGGESKDGLPVICIILRNIEMEGMDYDVLLYCYLKIASKMWHRPFGILIDATSYNSLNEPPDELFKKLDSLTPTEMSKRLSRVYVYNMNSAYRKCFRRVLRLAARNQASSFHPDNVDYFLIGSLQDLQLHFHLGSLHLPKDTISVVTDSRYVYQPVTRLSKTKGKIDVVIKVGSQFVQITTAKKQEIVSGLRLHATVNDIFRLSEIEETSPSIQLDDESAFGFRTENGKIVMYFTSPKKGDILQAIRSAKTKQGNDAQPTRLIERLIRPEDVPGTLLNISLTNMAYSDQRLRLASYNLLCGLCRAFHFSIDKEFVGNKDLTIPSDCAPLIVGISSRLATSEPQLTNDFLLEFFVGWERCPPEQRLLNVMFMVPWLPNLWKYVLSQEPDGERGTQKIGVIARKLVDLAIRESSLRTWFQEEVWPVAATSDLMVELLLDYLIKLSQSATSDTEKTEVIATIAASMGGILARGKIIARLRKALNKSSLRPTKRLVDNAVWNETSVLLRLCLAVSFNSRVQVQLFLPELFHCITLLTNTGSATTRTLSISLIVNTVHAICTSLPVDEASLGKLKSIMVSLSDSTDLSLTFGVKPSIGAQIQESSTLSTLEYATRAMLEIMTAGAPSIDVANAWRARWMSLVSSTAFQNNPAMQTRAFGVMGFLIRDEVDDDLLYQILVAMRNSVVRFTEENDADMLLAILGALTRIMGNLSSTSRYLLQLYWLAMSLVRLAPPVLYRVSASFLEASLLAISASAMNRNRRMVPVLLQGRLPIEDALGEIDELCGVSFKPETFHIATSACLVKGLTDPVMKSTALRVLSTFLRTGSENAPEGSRFPTDLSLLPYIGVVIARATSADESREILWLAGVSAPPTEETTFADAYEMIDLEGLRDRELLLNAALILIDFKLCEDEVQQRALYFLTRMATQHPLVMTHLYEIISTLLDDVLRSTQSPGTLQAAHSLTRALSSNPRLARDAKSSSDLQGVLEDIGFGGLWRSSTFEVAADRKKCGEMVDKLIELIIA